MTDRQKRSGFGGIVVGALVMLTMAVPTSAEAATRSTPTEPPATEPETSEPPTTEPETSEPATTDATSGATETTDDDGIDGGVALLGVVGLFSLVGVAAWWMVRLKNDDDEPHPRQHGLDEPLPGQDLV